MKNKDLVVERSNFLFLGEDEEEFCYKGFFSFLPLEAAYGEYDRPLEFFLHFTKKGRSLKISEKF